MKLKSGRDFNANGDIFGIDECLRLYGGYDDGFKTFLQAEEYDWLEPEQFLNAHEVIEVCEIAIDRWQKLLRLAVDGEAKP